MSAPRHLKIAGVIEQNTQINRTLNLIVSETYLSANVVKFHLLCINTFDSKTEV